MEKSGRLFEGMVINTHNPLDYHYQMNYYQITAFSRHLSFSSSLPLALSLSHLYVLVSVKLILFCVHASYLLASDPEKSI